MDDGVDEEIMLYCRICDQRFSNQHNRTEHLASRGHLNKLCFELSREMRANGLDDDNEAKKSSCQHACPEHCGNSSSSSKQSHTDQSIDIQNTMETVIQKHSLREEEIRVLRENLTQLRSANASLQEEDHVLQVLVPNTTADHISYTRNYVPLAY